MSNSPSKKSATPWRIIFMGTPDFAVPSLQALIDGPDHVVAVVAQPDRPARRGRKLQTPPTIRLASQHQIPTLQPKKVKGPAFLEALRQFEPDLTVVAAYGRILVQPVLDLPKFGSINVHGSILPKYRGASPIQWALLKGENITGITTMLMDAGLDTGDILLKKEVPIPPGAHAGQMHDILAKIGADLLIETIDGLKCGRVSPQPQDHTQATLAPMMKKEDGLIDWGKSATEIGWHIQGMSPWPGAFTFVRGRRLTLLAGSRLDQTSELPPGTVVSATAQGIDIATGEGCYRIEHLKPENSRAMDAAAFLCGYPLTSQDRLTNGIENL